MPLLLATSEVIFYLVFAIILCLLALHAVILQPLQLDCIPDICAMTSLHSTDSTSEFHAGDPLNAQLISSH